MRNKDFIPKFQTPQARQWCCHYNSLRPSSFGERLQALKALLHLKGPAWVESGFQCAVGSNITLGVRVFMNHGVTIEDLHTVWIGEHALLGPHTRISTLSDTGANHNEGAPVHIGANVWIGAHVTIGPGAHIGDNCVIGAGSVVRQTVPDNTVAYGQTGLVFRPL